MSVFQAKCRTLNEASMSERHEEWMALFGRTYKNDAEKEKRFLIFKDNVELIESFNKVGNRPYKLNINEYADQTIEEFQASRNGYKRPFSRPSTQKPSRYENVSELPSSIDWTKKGGVTPVTDQNQCGNSSINLDDVGRFLQWLRWRVLPSKQQGN
ncbi:senescence-specific cysteine protease SAG39-like [Ziziphus jujuba]|uniref:Senescence-specific cysteine protease SAG39-like n=1 Tax=Ziziphus jujuba TaxID=326968 RepID=A0ABM3I797_ZIZJJ|nr:senescence-specific cysteine protease SAG39-like [Ziziphus jujuba]